MTVISLPKNIVSTSIDHWHCMHMRLRKGTGYTKKPIPYPKNKQADTFFRLLVYVDFMILRSLTKRAFEGKTTK